MKKLENLLRYILCLPLLLAVLIVLDIVVMTYVQGTFDEGKRIAASISVTASELSFESGEAVLTEKGRARVDSLDGFAFLISESGEVIWEYKKPSEIPERFSLTDVASFSRWYLCDYPVYSYIMELPTDGSRAIFVLGQPKGSLWKYQLVYGVNSLSRFPYLIAADILILFIVPLFVTRRSGRRREKERTEWIAGISHDIRTPLTMAMLGTTKLLDENPDKATAEAARQLLSHEMRIKGLIENLNADNRMLYGRGKRVREPVQLPAVIRGVLCAFADANDGLPFDFVCDIDGEAEDCVIRSDEALVRRLMENLVGNSVRHNPDGCSVTVALSRRKTALLRPRYILRVSDDGVGASPELLAALNGRHESPELREHGLGLRVVKHIAREYRWGISFSSASGEGFEAEIKLH